jgi:hypothetical protein
LTSIISKFGNFLHCVLNTLHRVDLRWARIQVEVIHAHECYDLAGKKAGAELRFEVETESGDTLRPFPPLVLHPWYIDLPNYDVSMSDAGDVCWN